MVFNTQDMKEIFFFMGSFLAIVLSVIRIYEFIKQKPKIFFEINDLRFYRDYKNDYLLDVDINLINKGKEETAIQKIKIVRNIYPDEEVQAPLSNKRVVAEIDGFKLPIREPMRKKERFNLGFKKDYSDFYVELTVVDMNGKEITKKGIVIFRGGFTDLDVLKKTMGKKGLEDQLKSYNIKEYQGKKI